MTLLRPNPSLGVPVYLQLMEQVRHAIRTGALQPGESLPGIRPLAEALVVNPNAVRRAYDELEQEGVIEAGRDAGEFGSMSRRVGPARHGGAQRLQSAHWPSNLGDLVRENNRLSAQIASEVAERVRRTRELEVAREVQQRLFPQDQPAVEGLDCAGASRPAHGIGGDYYDFIRLSDSALGIVMGDVCGKGTPAALLMATLRAYVRSQTWQGGSALTEVAANLNRLVYESSPANRYASFFYGQYDSRTRTLDYVNAGHTPPVVVRARGEQPDVVRLEVGGPVIGLMPTCSYCQHRITLRPGDSLVAFTDGISESRNADDEEWGEESLIQIVGANRERQAWELVEVVMRTADAFAAGAPQYDDMTIVTARVNSMQA